MEKMSNLDIVNRIEQEDLSYAILHWAIGPEMCEDKKMATYIKNAVAPLRALDDFQSKLSLALERCGENFQDDFNKVSSEYPATFDIEGVLKEVALRLKKCQKRTKEGMIIEIENCREMLSWIIRLYGKETKED